VRDERGEGGGREVKEWRGGAAPLYQLIAGQDGMTIHNFPILAIKKRYFYLQLFEPGGW
jgi:hypothetical protein